MNLNPKRILIVRLSAIGDVIDTMHTLRALRAGLPDSRIDWVVESSSAPLLQNHPDLNECLVVPRKKWGRWVCTRGLLLDRESARTAARIKANDYTLVLDLHGNFKSAMTARLARAPIVGFPKGHCRELNHFFSTCCSKIANERCHRIERALSVLPVLGLGANFAQGVIPIAEEDRSAVQAFLKAHDLQAARLAVLNPATSPAGLHKRWPDAHWAALGARLIDEGFQVLFTHAPGEEFMIRNIMQAAPEQACSWCPSLLQLGALFECAHVVVSPDTGPTHLAVALDVPLVALYGPTNPRVYGPFCNTHAKAIWKEDPDTAPARSKIMGLMHKIKVDEVLAACLSVAGSSSK